MPLHRLTVPVYFGGLPGTHDYINDPAANGDSGVPVLADSKKSGGVNDGTYFVAFSEPATSTNTNRGLKALSQNTDYLDDIVHRDLATPVLTVTATAVGVVSSIVLPGNVFVGAPGSVDDQRTRSGLVALIDGNGLPIQVTTVVGPGNTYLTPVTVSLIHNGASLNVIGNSYFTGPTINLSPPIPNGQTYKISYYTRNTLVVQNEAILTRFQNGVFGYEALWTHSRDTRESAVTFSGEKTFTNNVTVLADTALLNLAITGFITSPVSYKKSLTYNNIDQSFALAATGILGTNSTADQDTISHPYQLLHAYKTTVFDNVRVRVYSSTASEYVITSNARWGGGGAQSWFADDTSFDAVKVSIGPSGLRWESKNSITPASWLDSAWNGTVGAGRGIPQLFFAASLAIDQDDATSPMLKSNKRAADHPGFPANQFKLVGEWLTGTGVIKARIYSGGTGANLGLLNVTLNAFYDPATSLWAADNTAIPAMRFTWEVAAGTGLILASSKAITTVPWADTFGSWDTVQTPGIGSYYSTDEFRWLGTRTKTMFVPLSNGIAKWNGGSTDMEWQITFLGVLFWIQRLTLGNLYMPLPVPQGATLNRVRIMGTEVAGNPWSLELAKDSGYDFTTPPGTVVHTTLDSDVTSGAGGAFVVTLTCTEIIDKSATQYWALIQGGTAGAGHLLGVEIRFNQSFVSNY